MLVPVTHFAIEQNLAPTTGRQQAGCSIQNEIEQACRFSKLVGKFGWMSDSACYQQMTSWTAIVVGSISNQNYDFVYRIRLSA